MKVLITGGTGFIGSHLAHHLLNQGHTVTLFDLKKTKVAGCRAIAGDITDEKAVEAAINGHDAVVHLAALVSVPETITHPELAEAINVTGSINVLRTAKLAGVKKVVLASSAAVYGENPRMPTRETEPLAPMSPYASTKIAMEIAAAEWARGGLPTVCLRFFNVYGPGQNPESQYAAVIPTFIAAALHGKTITINGDGAQTRDFIYVEDVCRAIELALTKGNGTINIATGKSVTISEIAKEIILLTNSKSATVHAPARKGDPRMSLAEVAKAKKELGFTATTRFDDGLRKTIEFFRK